MRTFSWFGSDRAGFVFLLGILQIIEANKLGVYAPPAGEPSSFDDRNFRRGPLVQRSLKGLLPAKRLPSSLSCLRCVAAGAAVVVGVTAFATFSAAFQQCVYAGTGLRGRTRIGWRGTVLQRSGAPLQSTSSLPLSQPLRSAPAAENTRCRAKQPAWLASFIWDHNKGSSRRNTKCAHSMRSPHPSVPYCGAL